MTQYKENSDTSIIDKIDYKEPPMYQVILHNDDYTSMDFVVSILMQIFEKSEMEAEVIMLNVHNDGSGIAGVYTHEIAETKIEIVHYIAREQEFPLRCSMKRDS